MRFPLARAIVRAVGGGAVPVLFGVAAIPVCAAPDAPPRAAQAPVARPNLNKPVAEYGRIEVDYDGLSFGLRQILSRSWIERRIKDRDDVVRYRKGAPGVYRVRFASNGSIAGGEVRVVVTIDAQTKNRAVRATGEAKRSWIEGVVPPKIPFTPAPPIEDVRPYPLPFAERVSQLDGARAGDFCLFREPNNKDAKEREERKKREDAVPRRPNDSKKPDRKDDDKKPDKAREDKPDKPRAAPNPAPRDKGEDKPDKVRRAPDPAPRDKSEDKPDKTRRAPDPAPRAKDKESDAAPPPVAAAVPAPRGQDQPDKVRRAPDPRPDAAPPARDDARPAPAARPRDDAPSRPNAPNPNPGTDPRDNPAPPAPPENGTSAPNPLPPPNATRSRGSDRSRPPVPSSIPTYRRDPNRRLSSKYRGNTEAARLAFDGAFQQARGLAEIDIVAQLRGI